MTMWRAFSAIARVSAVTVSFLRPETRDLVQQSPRHDKHATRNHWRSGPDAALQSKLVQPFAEPGLKLVCPRGGLVRVQLGMGPPRLFRKLQGLGGRTGDLGKVWRLTVICMKTTLNIDDTVMRRLREEAARRPTTMSSMVEAGLRLVLADSGEGTEDAKPLPPLPSWQSGGQRVDIANREVLYGVMEGE